MPHYINMVYKILWKLRSQNLKYMWILKLWYEWWMKFIDSAINLVKWIFLETVSDCKLHLTHATLLMTSSIAPFMTVYQRINFQLCNIYKSENFRELMHNFHFPPTVSVKKGFGEKRKKSLQQFEQNAYGKDWSY